MTPAHLARWFEAHRARLHEVARHIVGTRADADDVVQDACVKALTGLDAAIRSPDAWMTTTVRNLAFDRLRHRRVVERFALDEPLSGAPRDVGIDDAQGARLEAAAVVLRIVDALDERDAVAWLLRVVFDEDHATLARRFGTSDGAMRVALHRATRQVRDRASPRGVPHDDRVARTFAICWEAVATRDASVLHALIDAQGSLPAASGTCAGPDVPPIRLSIVHQGGRYVLAWRQGDQLICVLPIGMVPDDRRCTVD